MPGSQATVLKGASVKVNDPPPAGIQSADPNSLLGPKPEKLEAEQKPEVKKQEEKQ